MRVMKSILAQASCCVVFATAACEDNRGANWPLRDVNSRQVAVKFESATKFLCDGVPCELLGVSESKNAAVRRDAADFVHMWLNSIGQGIFICNDNPPLQRADGTCLVWVTSRHSPFSCLNTELVRAGLVEVDYGRDKDYSFEAHSKSGPELEDWKGDLDKAKEGHQRGEKPRVRFTWPR